MNKRQWSMLLAGTVSVAALVVFGTSHLHPPGAGSVVEISPGHYSASFTDTVTPMWVLAASLGIIMLTGTLIYRSRKNV